MALYQDCPSVFSGKESLEEFTCEMDSMVTTSRNAHHLHYCQWVSWVTRQRMQEWDDFHPGGHMELHRLVLTLWGHCQMCGILPGFLTLLFSKASIQGWESMHTKKTFNIVNTIPEYTLRVQYKFSKHVIKFACHIWKPALLHVTACLNYSQLTIHIIVL